MHCNYKLLNPHNFPVGMCMIAGTIHICIDHVKCLLQRVCPTLIYPVLSFIQCCQISSEIPTKTIAAWSEFNYNS